MAKKFILKQKAFARVHEILISNEDAYLMRNFVWSVHYRNGVPDEVIRNVAAGIQESLARRITGAGINEFVWHANGNFLDVRRSNLIVLDAKAHAQKTRDAKAVAA